VLFYATDYPEAGKAVAKLITASGLFQFIRRRPEHCPHRSAYGARTADAESPALGGLSVSTRVMCSWPDSSAHCAAWGSCLTRPTGPPGVSSPRARTDRASRVVRVMDHAVDDRDVVLGSPSPPGGRSPWARRTLQPESIGMVGNHSARFYSHVLPRKINTIIFSRHYINSVTSVGRGFHKRSISYSRLIIGKASHIEIFQEHADKSSWDVIPHDA
jgi:hypothetical protein